LSVILLRWGSIKVSSRKSGRLASGRVLMLIPRSYLGSERGRLPDGAPSSSAHASNDHQPKPWRIKDVSHRRLKGNSYRKEAFQRCLDRATRLLTRLDPEH
jgi:hypothetical protein